ncbi:polysaccharide deacetylase family protein [Streptomyces sp. NPDC050560]|uniref:polysaccharide deacetylase family protein n=1 Tax=Streptomyces sp. NPDC050560 TaxID=3365630 RepID=UPI0037B29EFF
MPRRLAAVLLTAAALAAVAACGDDGRAARAGRSAPGAEPWQRWGLDAPPLRPPAPPSGKPELPAPQEPGLPPVVSTVPTKEKILFLTIDDGVEKDPDFVRMMSELDLPYTAFLSDRFIKDDYAYFARLRTEHGTVLGNHTLTHPRLTDLTAERQSAEICGMQQVLDDQYGQRPDIFRPPYGTYDTTTLEAAAGCGIRTVLRWQEQVFPDRVAYDRPEGDFAPGDVVLTHFKGEAQWNAPMADAIRRLLNTITPKGYALAALMDYLP